jgi:hypothetical protein
MAYAFHSIYDNRLNPRVSSDARQYGLDTDDSYAYDAGWSQVVGKRIFCRLTFFRILCVHCNHRI